MLSEIFEKPCISKPAHISKHQEYRPGRSRYKPTPCIDLSVPTEAVFTLFPTRKQTVNELIPTLRSDAPPFFFLWKYRETREHYSRGVTSAETVVAQPGRKKCGAPALSSVSRSQELLEANYFNEFHAGSFSRKRVPRERGAGGPAGDRPGNTGLGDRNPGGPRRVPEYLPIRVDPRGPLLPGDRTVAGHNRRRKLRTSVSAREVQ